MLVNITFLPRGRESIAWECQQVCGLKKGDSIEAFLSNQRVSTSSMKRPKRGTHRAFQNPRDMEKLDRGLYQSPEQLALAPTAPVCGTLSSRIRENLYGTLRNSHSQAWPSGILLAKVWGGPGNLDPHRAPRVVRTPALHFSFLTWIQAPSCVRRSLYVMALFIVGLSPWSPSLPPFPGTLPMVNTDPYMYVSL